MGVSLNTLGAVQVKILVKSSGQHNAYRVYTGAQTIYSTGWSRDCKCTRNYNYLVSLRIKPYRFKNDNSEPPHGVLGSQENGGQNNQGAGSRVGKKSREQKN